MARLGTKITIPFVALFAVLLLVLGTVLVSEILSAVESRVVDEQRFVLEVAAFPNFSNAPGFLRQIRDHAAGSGRRAELIVTQRGAQTVSTLEPEGRDARLLADFENTKALLPSLLPDDDAMHRDLLTLGGERWLVLFTSRATHGAAAGEGRRFYFLLYPYAEIEGAKNLVLSRVASLGAIGLLCAAVLGLVLAHWISAPVRRLAAAAQRISAGGLDEPLDPFPTLSPTAGKGDEIAELAQAFQTMVASLRQSQHELIQAERLAVTGKLAAGVAHEIRNPLTSMRMTLQTLQQRYDVRERTQTENLEPSTRQAYTILLGEIDRLALAVEELLVFARPRPAQREPTELNQLVTDTLHLLERQLAHAKVHAVSRLDPAMPAGLLLDPHRLRQVLVNLILNAQQAIVRDGTITVRTFWDSEKRQALITVHDTGAGVAPGIRDSLFELFTSTKPGGGGLGLAIAKQIAEEHGGTISYESEPGNTTFTVVLPAGN